MRDIVLDMFPLWCQEGLGVRIQRPNGDRYTLSVDAASFIQKALLEIPFYKRNKEGVLDKTAAYTYPEISLLREDFTTDTLSMKISSLFPPEWLSRIEKVQGI
jgi:hypothetical protein